MRSVVDRNVFMRRMTVYKHPQTTPVYCKLRHTERKKRQSCPSMGEYVAVEILRPSIHLLGTRYRRVVCFTPRLI